MTYRARVHDRDSKSPHWYLKLGGLPARLLTDIDTVPYRTAAIAAAVTAIVAGLLAGPVAAGLAAAYTGWPVLSWHRHRAAAALTADRRAARQAISLLAADLRAGIPPEPALSTLLERLPQRSDPVCRQIRYRLAAVRSIAERSGVPTAALLDRLCEDLRATARIADQLAGNTAGTVASVKLLTALPVVGLLLGQSIGAEPVSMLLTTPLGAACAVAAAVLQLLGVAWSRRILAGVTAPPEATC
jgi:tight adherence protein B